VRREGADRAGRVSRDAHVRLHDPRPAHRDRRLQRGIPARAGGGVVVALDVLRCRLRTAENDPELSTKHAIDPTT
jgi:hypothetical protein